MYEAMEWSKATAAAEAEARETTEEEVAKANLTLQIDYPKTPKAEKKLKTQIVADVAKALRIKDKKRICVEHMRPGSVVADVAIRGKGASDLGKVLASQIADKNSKLYKGKVTKHVQADRSTVGSSSGQQTGAVATGADAARAATKVSRWDR